MDKTADERRELLRKFVADRGLKVARWAKDAGVDKNAIYNFLNNHQNSLNARIYAKLARAAGVPAWKISGEQPEPPSPTSIWVVGAVQAGVFHDAVEWDQPDWYPVDVPVPDRFQRKAKALEVSGPSMNLEYPEKSIVVWVDILDARAPRDGDHLIVYAHRSDDSVEATIKELRIVDGKHWLWPRSSHPEFQTPIDPDNPPSGIATIEIKGLVIGGYRPRQF